MKIIISLFALSYGFINPSTALTVGCTAKFEVPSYILIKDINKPILCQVIISVDPSISQERLQALRESNTWSIDNKSNFKLTTLPKTPCLCYITLTSSNPNVYTNMTAQGYNRQVGEPTLEYNISKEVSASN